MSPPDSGYHVDDRSTLVGLVDIEGFCGGPIMVFKNEPDPKGRRQRLTAPSLDGPAAQKAAAVDLSESLSQLYDQAVRLGYSEAALFIGCASLSISETLSVESGGGRVPDQAAAQKTCDE